MGHLVQLLKVREETSGSTVVHACNSALGTVKHKGKFKASLGSYILESCSLKRKRMNNGQRNGKWKEEERKKGKGSGRKEGECVRIEGKKGKGKEEIAFIKNKNGRWKMTQWLLFQKSVVQFPASIS